MLKYKKNDEDESLKDKFSRLNIHSISKKSKRVTGHLKILTGGEPQVNHSLCLHIILNYGVFRCDFMSNQTFAGFTHINNLQSTT